MNLTVLNALLNHAAIYSYFVKSDRPLTPRRLTELMKQGGETAERAFNAMMKMHKIDIAALERAVSAPA